MFAIKFDEPAWPDLNPTTPCGTLTEGSMLVGGMQSGESSVMFRMDDVDGVEGSVLGQMSLDQLEMFVKACRAREEYLAGLTGAQG